MTGNTFWNDLQKRRAGAPLIHNITNFCVDEPSERRKWPAAAAQRRQIQR